MLREKIKTFLVPVLHPNAQQLPKEICKHLHLGDFDRLFELFELGTVYATITDSLMGKISVNGQLINFVRFSEEGSYRFEALEQTFTEWEFLDFLFIHLPSDRQNLLLDAHYKPFKTNPHTLTSFRWQLEKQMRRSMMRLLLDNSTFQEMKLLDSNEENTELQFRLVDQSSVVLTIEHTKNDAYFDFRENGSFDFYENLIAPVEHSLTPTYPGIYFHDLFFHNSSTINLLFASRVISVFQNDRRHALRATFDSSIRLHPDFQFDFYVPDYWSNI